MLKDKRQLTDLIKFLAAIAVVQGHLWSYYTPYQQAASWLNIGSQCVGLFLFFSAYGLQTALDIKGKAYLQGFFSKRLSRVIIPLITAYAITLPVYSLFRGEVNWKMVLANLDWGGPYLQFTWYVSEIIILYVLFWLSARCSIKYQQWILTAMVLCLFPLFTVVERPIWWFTGLPCFLLGVWYQKYESRLTKGRMLIITASIVLFFISKRWCDIAPTAECLSRYRYQYIANYIADFTFVCLIVNVLSCINKQIKITPPYLTIVNSYYEIYLMQNCCFIIMSQLGLAPWYLVPSAILLTIFVATATHKFNSYISSIINN